MSRPAWWYDPRSPLPDRPPERTNAPEGPAAKVAKPAKVDPETENFRNIRNFRTADQGNNNSREERRAWAEDYLRKLSGWLSVIPPDVWRLAAIGERVAPLLARAEGHAEDYVDTGNPADRKAAVWACEHVAVTANRAAKEWTGGKRRTTPPQRQT